MNILIRPGHAGRRAAWVNIMQFYPNRYHTPAQAPGDIARSCAMKPEPNYSKWMCLICGFIYDEEKGLPDEGITAGTRWEDIPPNWTCPECGARKEDFEMVKI
jgi:rubredoxin